MALESEKRVDQNAMQLRIFGINQFHLRQLWSSQLSFIWYSMRLKGSPFLYLVGGPEQMFPYREMEKSLGIKSFYRQKKNSGVTKRGHKRSPGKLSTSPVFPASDPPVHCSTDLRGDAAGENVAAADVERLREFDLDMRYGPCLGLSRIERWDRASAMGLDPPADVEAILLSSSAAGECLWDGRV